MIFFVLKKKFALNLAGDHMRWMGCNNYDTGCYALLMTLISGIIGQDHWQS